MFKHLQRQLRPLSQDPTCVVWNIDCRGTLSHPGITVTGLQTKGMIELKQPPKLRPLLFTYTFVFPGLCQDLSHPGVSHSPPLGDAGDSALHPQPQDLWQQWQWQQQLLQSVFIACCRFRRRRGLLRQRKYGRADRHQPRMPRAHIHPEESTTVLVLTSRT